MSDSIVEQVIDLEEGEVFGWEDGKYRVYCHLPFSESLCVDLSNNNKVTFNSYTWVRVKVGENI